MSLQPGATAVISSGPAEFRGHLVLIVNGLAERRGVDQNGAHTSLIGYQCRDLDTGQGLVCAPSVLAVPTPEALTMYEFDARYGHASPNTHASWQDGPWRPAGPLTLTADYLRALHDRARGESLWRRLLP